MTTNNTLIDAILVNRGFSNAKINADTVSAETVKTWHNLLDDLHSASYKVAAIAYNTEGHVDYSPIYTAIAKVWEYIGAVNGGKLRSDENTALVLCSKATRESVKKSADLQYVYSQKNNSAKYLRELENTNGASKETIAKVKADIVSFNEKIDKLKKQYGNQTKQFSKVSASAFYKSVEDFIADMIEERLTMTEEEVQAEAEAKRQERRRKTAEKKAAQKNAEKKTDDHSDNQIYVDWCKENNYEVDATSWKLFETLVKSM